MSNLLSELWMIIERMKPELGLNYSSQRWEGAEGLTCGRVAAGCGLEGRNRAVGVHSREVGFSFM